MGQLVYCSSHLSTQMVSAALLPKKSVVLMLNETSDSVLHGVLKTLLYFFTIYQTKMGSPPCWLLLMLPIFHFTKWLTGQFLGTVTWPLGGEARGSCYSSSHKQVYHLLEKLFLLYTLCELSFHLMICLIYNTTSLSSYWFLFPIPKQKTNRQCFQRQMQLSHVWYAYTRSLSFMSFKAFKHLDYECFLLHQLSLFL